MYCTAVSRAEETPRKVAHWRTEWDMSGGGEGSGSGEGEGEGEGGKVASRNPVVRATTRLEMREY